MAATSSNRGRSRGRNGRIWATSQAEVAEFFHVSPRTVSLWFRSGMPGRRGHYDLGKVARWHFAQLAARRAEADALLVGSGSPALELYRAERAKLAKLDRVERERGLVDPAKSLAIWHAMLPALELAAERIGTKFGPEAAAVVAEAVREADKLSQRFSAGG